MVVLLLAALRAGAEETSAPLENSKQELKSLQKGAAPGVDASLGKMSDVMPQMQSPVNEPLPFDLTKTQKSESELNKKEDAQKNWLLDGMDKLDPKTPKSKEAGRKNAANVTGDDDKEKAGEADSGDLLTLYSEQKKTTEAKAGAKQTKPARNDPMTPFLQGWLADSPVRGKFFDDYVKRPDGGATNSGAVGSAQPDSSSGLNFSVVDGGASNSRNVPSGPAPVRVNPYLQGLDMSGLQDLGGGGRQSASNPVLQAGPIQPPPPLADPVPALRPPDKKLQLPSLTDDKKYFPQLNKF